MARKRRYKPIPRHLYEELVRIAPSENCGLKYYPCRVTLTDGQCIDRVYVVEQEPYIKVWGVYPEDDRAKSSVLIEGVADLEESPSRLPPDLANKRYEGGESGMGYTTFTVVFSDGTRQSFLAGNAIDFISFPKGKSQADIVDIIPYGSRDFARLEHPPGYSWCIYSGVE